MTELLVETTNLTKRYGPRAAVDHVGLQVRGGTPGVTDVVGGRFAALVLVAYLAMFVAASAVLVRRRDVA